MNQRYFLVAVLLLVATYSARAADWNQFRGPNTDGVAEGSGYPTQWSAESNIKWKAALPGNGNSSPVVSAGRVFVTAAEDEGRKRSLLCFDRTNGKQLWVQSVAFDRVTETHKTNPYCGSTPAADGQHVVVWHGSAGLYCYDFEGTEVWNRQFGEFKHIWGYGTSPIILGDRVIVHCGPGQEVFMTAVDLKTGETLWRTDEPIEGNGSYNANKKYMGSWSSPVVAQVGDRQRIFCTMPTRVNAYDPETGEIVWSCQGIGGPRGDLAYSSPMILGDIGVAQGGFRGPAIGFRLTGEGDVTETARLWRVEEGNPQNIGTGVFVDGYLYKANAGPSTLQCIDPQTGKELWQERAPGDNYWGSIVLADGRMYVTNQRGDTDVILPNPEKLELVTSNKLGEPSNSTPAFSDGEIFLRTAKSLYCVAN